MTASGWVPACLVLPSTNTKGAIYSPRAKLSANDTLQDYLVGSKAYAQSGPHIGIALAKGLKLTCPGVTLLNYFDRFSRSAIAQSRSLLAAKPVIPKFTTTRSSPSIETVAEVASMSFSNAL
jgi:hypothetical protein